MSEELVYTARTGQAFRSRRTGLVLVYGGSVGDARHPWIEFSPRGPIPRDGEYAVEADLMPLEPTERVGVSDGMPEHGTPAALRWAADEISDAMKEMMHDGQAVCMDAASLLRTRADRMERETAEAAERAERDRRHRELAEEKAVELTGARFAGNATELILAGIRIGLDEAAKGGERG